MSEGGLRIKRDSLCKSYLDSVGQDDNADLRVSGHVRSGGSTHVGGSFCCARQVFGKDSNVCYLRALDGCPHAAAPRSGRAHD